MFEKRYYYLITCQYLGYRFHGWQKQPNLKTVHLMIDKTLNFILEGKRFKTLGSGRTDAMVSATEAAFELFIYHEIEDIDVFLKLFNQNLPQDIRALKIRQVDAEFNVIQDSKVKEYLYVFAHGDKFHPFCAPVITTILDELDTELMKAGAKLFEGHHYFKSYCYKPTDNGIYNREILTCEIVENTVFTANFFPEQSFILRVRGKGFMRNQIRLMMGVLIELGKGEKTLQDIADSLHSDNEIIVHYIAPASGLILNKVDFS
ncbi:tRNA pseudouridine synthase A [Bizionia myxarmorum]|uniref:tRNA pseudouridine synthase A n=1 Tax=Bizionia myxarmorum TaxID=291186 RepID=A0A5D0R725_9FLAO|nr:tRNA pseudouridine(38-40) synthase TruA [Bizionia myxarmorum]TYB76478.1 tRNA pseudouridine(38-40) synthase TruA [Bizionia myxarmorum]